MAVTFDPKLTRPLDELRLALGDTRVKPQEAAWLADETYEALLSKHGDEALLHAAHALKSRLAQEPDSFTSAEEERSFKERVKAVDAVITRNTPVVVAPVASSSGVAFVPTTRGVRRS